MVSGCWQLRPGEVVVAELAGHPEKTRPASASSVLRGAKSWPDADPREAQIRAILTEYQARYSTARPHQGIAVRP